MNRTFKIILLSLIVAARLTTTLSGNVVPVKIVVTVRYAIFDDERRWSAKAIFAPIRAQS
jgi:hypothetical protein